MSTPVSEVALSPQLVGMKGWLLLFCVVLVIIIPTFVLFGIVQTLPLIEGIEKRVPGVTGPLTLFILADLALACFSAMVGYGLWKKPHRFQAVTSARYFLRAVVIVRSFNILLALSYPLVLLPSAILAFIQGCIFAGVWSSFLKNSKRVQATYLTAADSTPEHSS